MISGGLRKNNGIATKQDILRWQITQNIKKNPSILDFVALKRIENNILRATILAFTPPAFKFVVGRLPTQPGCLPTDLSISESNSLKDHNILKYFYL